MNREHPDEIDAKEIVERVLEVLLEHADKYGGVDYRSVDGRIALEVTRVTDGWKAASRSALRASRDAGVPEGELQNCWLVFASETQSGLKTFLQRVHPLLLQLEAAGEQSFWDQPAQVHVLERGPLFDIYLPLLQAGVERALAAPHHDHADPSHSHRIIPSLGGGGSVGGSDEALAGLVAELGRKPDNPAKLSSSGAEQRHLFVWLDDDSRFDIARPLSRDAPTWDDGQFGLPSLAPRIDPAVTHLWVVHQRSRRGWLWDGTSWRSLEGL
ncbi:hypothetical protein [Leifsonia sp. TF02-11]|uniref:hypothetical protein n=1 Tax=Leifsonia sp. TF02-11 TaxID=2815212 RepID=UPI001AA1AFFA|nr:hypothetical protein [Leifsonia sp. TF02-11]MBO1740722.1 hypothetical protein [Leifsonia sp. TF02-11]